MLVPASQAQELELALAELPPRQKARWASYRVRSGDSLSGIAQRQGTTVAALRKANRLIAGQALQVGQELAIPGGRQADTVTEKTQTKPESYKVRRGDSLASIGRNFRITSYNVCYTKLLRADWPDCRSRRG